MEMTHVEQIRDDVAGLKRADVILVAVPLLFVGIYGLGALLFENQTLAVGVAAVACTVAIGDGIFWHPPTDE